MLEIKNGGMAVNGHRLFGNLSFTIHEGEVLGVSSEDDAATTMLLRTVLGFEPLSEGYLSIDHELMNTRSASFFRHRMSYLPKDVNLPYETVSELLDELSSLCTPHLTREQFFEFWTELSIAPAVYD
jgi:ABC-type multidrug transport system ATPase subunit